MHAFLKTGKVPAGGASVKSTEAGTSGLKRPKKPQPWVEKYRPQKVDEVAYQEEVVAVLKKSLQGSDLPNLLFYGPPGTGKTSTILAMAKELFGDMYRDRILELNASDERGISVVRDKVKRFAQLTASGTRPDGRPCPAFKIVILDEADSMTSHAQAALRRTMEKEAKTTRFCLICNYVSRIIEPLTSRCAKFRFKPLSADTLSAKLREIAEKENVMCDEGAIKALLDTSEGDMRKAITFLQSAARLRPEEPVTSRDICEIAGVIDDDVIQRLIDTCRTNSYDKVDTQIKNVMADGHSAVQLITQLHDVLVQMDDLNDKQKSAILEQLAVVDKRLLDGADEYLQLMDLCCVVMDEMSKGSSGSSTS